MTYYERPAARELHREQMRSNVLAVQAESFRRALKTVEAALLDPDGDARCEKAKTVSKHATG